MMRTLAAVLFTLLAFPLSAANVSFDPPNPTSRTFVTAQVRLGSRCPPSGTDVRLVADIISITLKYSSPCPEVPPPPDGYNTAVDLGLLPPGLYRVSVGLEQLLIGLGDATLTIAEAAPELQVAPNVSEGGDEITIVGAGIAPVCAVAPCPAPDVRFDGVAAEVLRQIDTDRIVVRAPGHELGTVDISVTAAGQTRRATAAFNYFATEGARDPAFFEPVLFPVIVSGRGAFGSVWSTELSLRNENDYTFPVHSLFEPLIFSAPDLRPRAHSVSSAGSTSAPSGYLLYIPRQAAPRLFFGALVRDLSRQAEALGTEIPVVHEKDFFGRPFAILNIPTDSRYRVALRGYRIDDRFNLRLRIWRMFPEGAPLVDTFIFLARPIPNSGTHAAGYIGDLVTTYPQLAGKGPLRIEIDGTSDHPGAWAFVSVTNNETQHVTVISPQ